MSRALPLLPLLALVACVAPQREPVPAPPPPAEASAADPGRQAVLNAAYAFADTSRLAGRPAAAARAAAELEWMVAALPADPAWIPAAPVLYPMLRAARSELRFTLGVDPAASPVEVTRRLAEAAVALEGGSQAAASAALAPLAPGGGTALLGRLERLPQQPRAAQATALAVSELQRMMREDPE